jgi:8-oxo-dGTP pyrophosphatase MutT (NUDIX family)
VELCDVVDASGARTGRAVVRGTRLGSGEFHLVVHVWIRNEIGEYLIQQRALHLESGPGVWATTVGYVLTGEDSLPAAIRETREELGIELQPAQLTRFDRHTLETRVEDVWMAFVSKQAAGAPVPGPEVAGWKWVSPAELAQLKDLGKFFAYSYFDNLPK